MMIRRALGNKISLELRIHPGLWRACCDRNEFEISLMNLAVNARHAITGTGRVIITAKNGNQGENDLATFPKNYVEIIFEDNGCGMDPEILENATKPFFTTKPSGQGTGLGLSGVVKFAWDLGGAVRISSEKGVGTAVSILLPKEDQPTISAVQN
jgi:signal transduction histidine kinase